MNALIAYTSIQCEGVFTGFTGFAIRSFPDGELPPFQSLTLQPSGVLEHDYTISTGYLPNALYPPS